MMSALREDDSECNGNFSPTDPKGDMILPGGRDAFRKQERSIAGCSVVRLAVLRDGDCGFLRAPPKSGLVVLRRN